MSKKRIPYLENQHRKLYFRTKTGSPYEIHPAPAKKTPFLKHMNLDMPGGQQKDIAGEITERIKGFTCRRRGEFPPRDVCNWGINRQWIREGIMCHMGAFRFLSTSTKTLIGRSLCPEICNFPIETPANPPIDQISVRNYQS